MLLQKFSVRLGKLSLQEICEHFPNRSTHSGGNRNYVLSVILADTSQLKNRGLILAYIASPYLITTFTSGFFANAMLTG